MTLRVIPSVGNVVTQLLILELYSAIYPPTKFPTYPVLVSDAKLPDNVAFSSKPTKYLSPSAETPGVLIVTERTGSTQFALPAAAPPPEKTTQFALSIVLVLPLLCPYLSWYVALFVEVESL